MKKIIENNTIYFYENDNLVMYFDHSIDDFIWYFNTDKVVKITEDMDLYLLINNFMNEDYILFDSFLKDYKNKNKLIWYSDCYYNPDDKWQVDSVSCLHIERIDNYFNVWCTKKLDERIERKNKTYCIAFSPSGNGAYTKNIKTGLTLQDDIVTLIYQPLLNSKEKVLKK